MLATVDVPVSRDVLDLDPRARLAPHRLKIDGGHVGSVSTSGGLYAPLGQVYLSAGKHSVTLSYGSSVLAPGATAPIYQLGPLALVPAGLPAPVQYMAPAQAPSLCGKLADWIEVVSR